MEYIYLSSSSPRRQELLKQIKLPFKLNLIDVDESFDENLTPDNVVMTLAERKAKAGVDNLINNNCFKKDDKIIVICADTIVVSNNKIIGKPKNKKDAINILTSLSNNTHSVYTGLCIGLIKDKVITYKTNVEKTDVLIKKLSKTEIEHYINTNEPMDKAGAYAIQGLSSIFIEKIIGDYYNVVGLPLNLLYKMLEELGINITKYWN